VHGDTIPLDTSLLNTPIGVGKDPLAIRELQKAFAALGWYQGDINGIYNNELVDAVYNYQVASGLVSSPSDAGAGYWGEKTRGSFLKKYAPNGYIKVFRPDDVISRIEALKILLKFSMIEASNQED